MSIGTALVIDGQNLLMRAIFAAQHTAMSHAGVSTGPLVIFVNSLAKHVQIEQPARLVVVWDGGTSAKRIARLPSYKANRRRASEDEAQVRDSASELVHRFLTLAGVFSFGLPGHEADDLIAGAWNGAAPTAIDKIVILSSDKDFLQLLGPNPHGIDTELVRLSSADTPTDRWTEPRMVDTYGYSPRHWPLVTALAGDSVDGVPGLPGIGPKKAVRLLKAGGWDLEATVATLGPEAAEIVRVCFEVVNLRNITVPAPMPRWEPTHPGSALWSTLIEFLAAYELASIEGRLQAGELWTPPGHAVP